MQRRTFLRSSFLAAPVMWGAASAARSLFARVHVPVEWRIDSGKPYRDPFRDVSVDAVITGPGGARQTVPAFWAGDQSFGIRYAAAAPGKYQWRTVSTDTANPQLHGLEGTLDVEPYDGDNPLYRHGPLRVSASRRHLVYADGTPFFWLADTWWMALTKRLSWPDGFQRLTADRRTKGFNVIQLVAGLFPDMDSFDPRGENEAGFPWTPGYERIRPEFWDMADLRIQHLVARGLTPCILGCWGYYLPKLGLEKMKQHWRTIVARWGAYPVVWCLAGETSMPWYLSTRKDAEREELKAGWTEVARYVRQIDPFQRLVTAHPSQTGRDSVTDPSVLDFDMLQTGHSDRKSIPNTIRTLTKQYAVEPRMPVINGEVNYEGILAASREEIQRFMFWTCVLNGACGHTYGANGIWQVNLPGQPYGPSPHGRSWGDTPWEEAMNLPGSAQTGWAARWLRTLPWEKFEPHPEWVDPHWTAENYEAPSAAGIPGRMRVVYLPAPAGYPVTLRGLEPGVAYRAKLVNPVNGDQLGWMPVEAREGSWRHPQIALMQDWLLYIERAA